MDNLDFRLLSALMNNSRTPISRLAKKLGVSREVLTYRLDKLKNDGIILDFITEIDFKKLGFVGAAVFINIRANKQNEFESFLANADFVSWVARLSGIWSFGFSIFGHSTEELDLRFREIFNSFKEDIFDYRFILHKKSTFFYERYFGNSVVNNSDESLLNYIPDDKDKLILQFLSKNSRIESVFLANEIGLTAPAVANRIKKLERSGFIKKYSIFVDISKLGLFQYSVFLENKNFSENKSLINYLTQHDSISFVAEYWGNLFVEFGVFVDDPYLLRGILQDVEESFSEIRVVEVSMFQKEFVSVGLPSCVFR